MDFSLITLTGTVFHDTVSEILLRTPEGDAVIMPHHEPITAVVLPGPLTIRTKNKKEDLYAIFGGILEVADNKATLLADEADHADTLIETEIEEAIKLATDIKNSTQSRVELQRAKQIVDRHFVRLEVSKIRRRKRR